MQPQLPAPCRSYIQVPAKQVAVFALAHHLPLLPLYLLSIKEGYRRTEERGAKGDSNTQPMLLAPLEQQTLPSMLNCADQPVPAHTPVHLYKQRNALHSKKKKEKNSLKELFNAFLGILKLLSTELCLSSETQTTLPSAFAHFLFAQSNLEFCFQTSKAKLICIHCPYMVQPWCFLPLTCFLSARCTSSAVLFFSCIGLC